jgi:hypothetical protein
MLKNIIVTSKIITLIAIYNVWAIPFFPNLAPEEIYPPYVVMPLRIIQVVSCQNIGN